MTLQQIRNPATDLGKTIALLSDMHEALEMNSYTEEARLVSRHLEQLVSPLFETRIEAWGIDPVLEELAKGFSVSTTSVP